LLEKMNLNFLNTFCISVILVAFAIAVGLVHGGDIFLYYEDIFKFFFTNLCIRICMHFYYYFKIKHVKLYIYKKPILSNQN